MKRHSRKIITAVIVFPLLGAIVNVAVAWGCAAWIPLNIGGTHDSRFASRWYAEMKNVPSMPKQELETVTQTKTLAFAQTNLSRLVGGANEQWATNQLHLCFKLDGPAEPQLAEF